MIAEEFNNPLRNYIPTYANFCCQLLARRTRDTFFGKFWGGAALTATGICTLIHINNARNNRLVPNHLFVIINVRDMINLIMGITNIYFGIFYIHSSLIDMIIETENPTRLSAYRILTMI